MVVWVVQHLHDPLFFCCKSVLVKYHELAYTGSEKVVMADEEPRKFGTGAPLSADTIYQLINSSIQSGKPLWLVGANLTEAYLMGADLGGANLSGADLSRANLSRANLVRTDLSGANLSGADLRGSILGGANLSGTNGRGTKWPEGFDPEAAGALLGEE